MKKKFFLIIILPFLMGIFLQSCRDTDDLMKNPNTSLKDESIPPSIQAHDEIAMRTEDEFDYSQCSSIKSMVYKSGDKLVFQDIEHLENCAICLEQDYNSYNDQYDSQYPNATA